MDDTTKHRIIGGVILAASAAIFVPIFFKSSHTSSHSIDKRHEFEIPNTPAEPELALEDPPKVSEPMEPINDLAESATGKPSALPAEEGVEIANADPGQASMSPASEPAQVQELPQPQTVAKLESKSVLQNVPTSAKKEKAPQQVAEEEPAMEEGVAALPALPGPSVVSKPKLAIKQQHQKPVIAKAKTKPVVMATVHPATRPHSFIPSNTIKPVMTVATGSWVVQCASFSAKEHAAALQNKLAAAGFNAYIKNGASATGPVSRVFVGPQSDRPAAVALQNQLMAKVNTKGIIVNATVLKG